MASPAGLLPLKGCQEQVSVQVPAWSPLQSLQGICLRLLCQRCLVACITQLLSRLMPTCLQARRQMPLFGGETMLT